MALEEKEPDLAFVFIKEKNGDLRARKRTLFTVTCLEKLNINGRFLNGEEESEEELITSGNYKPSFLMINIDHPELENIITLFQEKYPGNPIIIISEVYFKDRLSAIKTKFDLKYDIPRTKINEFTLGNLIVKIQCDNAFADKNENKNSRYQYIKRLGDGASAIVDLYYDKEKKMQVAIKKMQVENKSEREQEQIAREVENMRSIKIPTSIELYDYQFENDNRFIYMEYADKGTLDYQIRDKKNTGGQFETEEIFDYVLEIMLALYALNKKGMVHRDIKSENILLKSEKIKDKECLIAKISDLGISRQIDGVLGSLTSCGTPYYVSPEIASGETRYDKNVDIWSLGVVLYELITLKKPWYDPQIDTKQLFDLIFTTKYPPLPEDTDPRLKFLVRIMLKKDPKRRADLTDILTLDFVYEKLMEIIKRYKWENVEDFGGIFDLGKQLKSCYRIMNLLDDDDFSLLVDASKLCNFSVPNEYKASFFGGTVKNAIKGDELLNTFDDIKTWENEKDHFECIDIKELMKSFLEKKIMIPLSHTLKNEDDFIEGFIKTPEKYYFKFTVNDFDPTSYTPDNKYLLTMPPISENFDFESLSQFVLKQGKMIYKDSCENPIEQIDLANDPRYLKFLLGISLFQECDLFELQYDEKNNNRLAFLLNLLQIMQIHCYFNKIFKNVKTKSGYLLGYFQNDIGVTYQFKNLTLNNLEVKHVVFRNNKPMPGSYMRLVYASDKKCQLLPNYNDLRPIFLLLNEYEPNTEKALDVRFKIFNSKEVDEQLNDITFDFINYNFEVNPTEVLTVKDIQPYLSDFDSNNTPEYPVGLLQFLLKYVNIHKEFLTPIEGKEQRYKLRLPLEKMESLEIFNIKYLRDIQNGNVKVTFI